MQSLFNIFPPCKRAKRATLSQQLNKVCEETKELKIEVDKFLATNMKNISREVLNKQYFRIAEETFDVINASFGLLAKIPVEIVRYAYTYIFKKMQERGDY